MFRRRVMWWAMMALIVSGCAGRGARQHLARLQSQLGLLDERVTQLERMSPGSPSGFSTSELPSESSTGSADAGATKTSSSAVVVHSKSLSASSKPSTRAIQQALKEAGFYQGTVDGKMGPMTRQAVEEFQRVNGLKPDGVVGHQTWAKLKQYAGLSSSGGTEYTK